MRGFIWGGMHGFIRGVCMVLFGGHAWFYLGAGGVCMVLSRGHVWFYLGGCAWFYLGGMRGFIWGAVVVLSRGHMWFYPGGGVRGFSSFFGYNEIRSMSGRYASYWNAFLLHL